MREELQLLKIIGVALVWRILHKESLCPYHIYRVQALALPNHRAKAVFYQWLCTICVVNTQFVANTQFTAEAN
jgi:hypothetical protein